MKNIALTIILIIIILGCAATKTMTQGIYGKKDYSYLHIDTSNNLYYEQEYNLLLIKPYWVNYYLTPTYLLYYWDYNQFYYPYTYYNYNFNWHWNHHKHHHYWDKYYYGHRYTQHTPKKHKNYTPYEYHQPRYSNEYRQLRYNPQSRINPQPKQQPRKRLNPQHTPKKRINYTPYEYRNPRYSNEYRQPRYNSQPKSQSRERINSQPHNPQPKIIPPHRPQINPQRMNSQKRLK